MDTASKSVGAGEGMVLWVQENSVKLQEILSYIGLGGKRRNCEKGEESVVKKLESTKHSLT